MMQRLRMFPATARAAKHTIDKVYGFLGAKNPLKALLAERTYYGLSRRSLNCSFWGINEKEPQTCLAPYHAPAACPRHGMSAWHIWKMKFSGRWAGLHVIFSAMWADRQSLPAILNSCAALIYWSAVSAA